MRVRCVCIALCDSNGKRKIGMSCHPFFSVIIPIYNVEKYLRECVDSVLSQTFRDIEIILVDDGSPDACPQICDEYAKNTPFVKVIHKKNGGLSDARNYGINEARGEYLLFLDSDDYWDDIDALKKIHHLICKEGNCDIVLFQAKILYPDGRVIPDKGSFAGEFNYMEPSESLKYLSKNGLLIGSACSKVISREFLINNALFFKFGIKSEDIDWTIRVADCLPKYLYLDEIFYMYRKGRSESITANVDYAYLVQFTDMLEKFATEYKYSSDETKNCLLSLVAYEFSILMAQTWNLSDKREKKQLTCKLRRMRKILAYDMHPKVKIINRLKKIIGFDCVMLLLGLYLKLRKR